MSDLERDRLNTLAWFVGGILILLIVLVWRFTDRINALEEAVYALAAQAAHKSAEAPRSTSSTDRGT